MDKRIILAVAGSGKTTYIINKLCLTKRHLIITYTISNTEHIRDSIIRKFGFIPENIKLISYFSFLYSFCFRPFLSSEIPNKGMYWKYPSHLTFKLKRDDLKYYINQSKRLYANRLAKLVQVKKLENHIKKRLEKYYDCIYIDEIQDFAGHDFDLLKIVAQANLDILFVGDFYQHTFDTSSDGVVNKNLHNDLHNFKGKFQEMGLKVDSEILIKSRRCSTSVCDFIREKIGIEIFSFDKKESKIHFITSQEEADEIFHNNEIVKLFLQKHYSYPCTANNWGNSKGIDKYNDVCVVLNSRTWDCYDGLKFTNLVPQTKNKLYVACSRARGDLYLVHEKLYKNYKKT